MAVPAMLLFRLELFCGFGLFSRVDLFPISGLGFVAQGCGDAAGPCKIHGPVLVLARCSAELHDLFLVQVDIYSILVDILCGSDSIDRKGEHLAEFFNGREPKDKVAFDGC